VTTAMIATAPPADVCDLLEIFADAYYHPGPLALDAIQAHLDDATAQLPLICLCTSLWSFAIFAFTPSISLQRNYANRIERELDALNPFQLCSVLWVFALFRSCTLGVWNTLVTKLSECDAAEIDTSALKYFYQVRSPVLLCLIEQQQFKEACCARVHSRFSSACMRHKVMAQFPR
jgi:hypothetical protein